MNRKSWHVYLKSGDRQLYSFSTDREEHAVEQAQNLISSLWVTIVEWEYDERETVLLDRPVVDG
jgi:hypothetical protein